MRECGGREVERGAVGVERGHELLDARGGGTGDGDDRVPARPSERSAA